MSAAAFAPVTIPSADQVRVARLAAGLTLQQAAGLAGVGAHQRWAEYENGRRAIDAARWELFLLKAGLHPQLELRAR